MCRERSEGLPSRPPARPVPAAASFCAGPGPAGTQRGLCLGSCRTRSARAVGERQGPPGCNRLKHTCSVFLRRSRPGRFGRVKTGAMGVAPPGPAREAALGAGFSVHAIE
jgi:hypothetical protein